VCFSGCERDGDRDKGKADAQYESVIAWGARQWV